MRGGRVIVSLLLVALVLVAYWGVWNLDFVYFDDPGYVTDNANVQQGMTWNNVKWAFVGSFGVQSNWHPLAWMSHMLDIEMFKLNGGLHHVTNLLLHLSNTLLIFLLWRRMTGKTWQSGAIAALFAIHPMHVESVAWVAERKDVLSTFLGLITIAAYIWYTGRPGVLRYCLVFVLFVLGLLAKPMLVTLPFVFLLLDYWPLRRVPELGGDEKPLPQPARRRPDRSASIRSTGTRSATAMGTSYRTLRARDAKTQLTAETSPVRWAVLGSLVVEKLPLLLLSIASSIITPMAQAAGGSVASTSELNISFRIQNALQSYMQYIGKMIWPKDMTTLYLLSREKDPLLTFGAVLALGLITAFALWATWNGRRYMLVGWFWYLGILVPVIGIVQVGEQTLADRYTYVPYLGIFIMVAWGLADLVVMFPKARLILSTSIAISFVAVVCSLVTVTQHQLLFWQDKDSFLNHALALNPDNWSMNNNMGVHLYEQGNAAAEAGHAEEAKALKARAVTYWQKAIAIRDSAADIHNNLGYAFNEAGRLDEAEAHLRKAILYKEILPGPHNNLGQILLKQGKTDEAIDEFREATKLDPSMLEAHVNLASALSGQGKFADAEKEYRDITDLQSDTVDAGKKLRYFVTAWAGIARLCAKQGRIPDAVEAMKKAEQLDPNAAEVHNAWADVLIAQGDLPAALEHYKAGIRFRPDRAAYANGVVNSLVARGNHKEALQLAIFAAYVMAAGPDPAMRNGPTAVQFGENAVRASQERDPEALDCLAAAYAEVGRFPDAVRAGQAAAQLADSQGKSELATEIRARVVGYENKTPYRMPQPRPGGGVGSVRHKLGNRSGFQ